MAQKSNAKERDPLIITRSELEAMSDAEKQAFRAKNGTVTEDPQTDSPNKPTSP